MSPTARQMAPPGHQAGALKQRCLPRHGTSQHAGPATVVVVPCGRVPRLHLLLLSLVVLPACDDRVNQCNALVERLNPHTDAMVRGVESLAHIESDAAAIEAWLQVLDAADRDLSTLQLADERLAGFALRYRRQLGEARKATEAMQAAAASKDPQGLNAAAKKADEFLDGQAKILDELNAYCSVES